MKRLNSSGFILMIVVMVALVGLVIFFAIKRITNARSTSQQTETAVLIEMK